MKNVNTLALLLRILAIVFVGRRRITAKYEIDGDSPDPRAAENAASPLIPMQDGKCPCHQCGDGYGSGQPLAASYFVMIGTLIVTVGYNEL